MDGVSGVETWELDGCGSCGDGNVWTLVDGISESLTELYGLKKLELRVTMCPFRLAVTMVPFMFATVQGSGSHLLGLFCLCQDSHSDFDLWLTDPHTFIIFPFRSLLCFAVGRSFYQDRGFSLFRFVYVLYPFLVARCNVYISTLRPVYPIFSLDVLEQLFLLLTNLNAHG